MSGLGLEERKPAIDVLYLIPGALGEGAAASAELDRRREFLYETAPDGCFVRLSRTNGGPRSVESEDDEAAAARVVVEQLPTLAKRGFDAVIIGCFADPGVWEARELVDLRVVGPAEASFRTAGQAGRTFAVLTVVDEVISLIRRRIDAADMSRQLTAVQAIGVGVSELRPNRDAAADRLVTSGRAAVRAGAEALVLGCMSMGFLGLEKELRENLSIPVVNPVLAALEAAANPEAFPRTRT